jgi:hypothetical protein
MTRQRAFQTATARRRANPIEWVIDDVTVRLKPSVDLIEISDLVESLQADTPEGVSEIKASQIKRETFLDIIRHFLEPDAHDAFASIAPDLDFSMLSEMIQELVEEYTGQANPTQEQSSSGGSPETGSSSTAGAPVEA